MKQAYGCPLLLRKSWAKVEEEVYKLGLERETNYSTSLTLGDGVNSNYTATWITKTFLDKSKSLDKYLPKGKSRRHLKVNNCGIGNPQRILL